MTARELQWYWAARRHGYRAIDAMHKAREWTHLFATYGSGPHEGPVLVLGGRR